MRYLVVLATSLLLLVLTACGSPAPVDAADGIPDAADEPLPCATTDDCPADVPCSVWRCAPSTHVCEHFIPDGCADAGADACVSLAVAPTCVDAGE